MTSMKDVLEEVLAEINRALRARGRSHLRVARPHARARDRAAGPTPDRGAGEHHRAPGARVGSLRRAPQSRPLSGSLLLGPTRRPRPPSPLPAVRTGSPAGSVSVAACRVRARLRCAVRAFARSVHRLAQFAVAGAGEAVRQPPEPVTVITEGPKHDGRVHPLRSPARASWRAQRCSLPSRRRARVPRSGLPRAARVASVGAAPGRRIVVKR